MESKCVFNAKAQHSLAAWGGPQEAVRSPDVALKVRFNLLHVSRCRNESRFQRSFTNMTGCLG
jgi:hypothetical protein